MFYAMGFYPDGYGKTVIRAIRISPFKDMDAAIRAIKRVGHGYVKKHSVKQPVWSNL